MTFASQSWSVLDDEHCWNRLRFISMKLYSLWYKAKDKILQSVIIHLTEKQLCQSVCGLVRQHTKKEKWWRKICKCSFVVQIYTSLVLLKLGWKERDLGFVKIFCGCIWENSHWYLWGQDFTPKSVFTSTSFSGFLLCKIAFYIFCIKVFEWGCPLTASCQLQSKVCLVLMACCLQGKK